MYDNNYTNINGPFIMRRLLTSEEYKNIIKYSQKIIYEQNKFYNIEVDNIWFTERKYITSTNN